MKILYLEIDDCTDCPFLRYNPHYSMSENSGWDCGMIGERIVNDGKDEENWDWSKIPDWCKLPKEHEVLE